MQDSGGGDPLVGTDTPALHYLSLIDVAELIRTRQLSPLELTRYMLERIESIDCRLNSYINVTADRAIAAARRAESEIGKGGYRGYLHGIPIALKDNCYMRFAPTSGGLRSEIPFIPEYDATVVAKLLQAGAIPLGKLRMTEGALSGYPSGEPIPVNPWGEALWAGASSSGCGVAVAAGLCFAALGSDTGGSIRLPAMANGVVGLKPTYGRVSRHGVLPLAQSLDHVGPLTRRSLDAAIVFETVAGFDRKDSTSLRQPLGEVVGAIDRGVAGLRIGFDDDYGLEGVDPELAAAMRQALATLERLGAEIERVALPQWTEEYRQAWLTICIFEAYAAHKNVYPPSLRGSYGSGMLKDFLDQGAGVTSGEYAEAMRIRELFTQRFSERIAGLDAVACSSGGVPFACSSSSLYGSLGDLNPLLMKIEQQFVEPTNFTGMPTLSLRCGFSEEGLPLTIQFIAKPLNEPVLLSIGHLYEEASGWYRRHPER